jgi:hypothetical protein
MSYYRGTRVIASSQAYPGVINVTLFSDTPPLERDNGGDLRVGDRWWNDVTSTEYIWKENKLPDGNYFAWQKINSDDLVYIGPNAPTNPFKGKLWFNSDTARLYVYYFDEVQNSYYWINIVTNMPGTEGPPGPQGPQAGTLHVGDMAPLEVYEGRMWFDTLSGQLFAATKDELTGVFHWVVVSNN